MSDYFKALILNQEGENFTREVKSIEKSFLKHELGSRIQLRVVPDLRFFYDDSMDYADRISTLLNKINKDESD